MRSAPSNSGAADRADRQVEFCITDPLRDVIRMTGTAFMIL
jgi:hypothetical protein